MRTSGIGLAVPLLLLVMACDGARRAGDDTAPAAAEAPSSQTHLFEKVADGIYFATGTGTVNVTSNSMVVVNDDDVLVVDSHITPDAARALIASVRTLTDLPIRFLVNTHFHFDHAHGNQAFPEDVLIIGHEYTRERLLGPVLEEPTYRVIGGPEVESALAAELESRLASAEDEETQASLEAQLATLRRHIGALAETVPMPPDTTLVRKLTLHRGGRAIELHHLGRGHTGGDVVVYLPAERIVFTGDLFYAGAPYLGDGYAVELIDTLERLKELDFDVVVPGHGPLVRDRALIDFDQEYLRSYTSQVQGFHAAGLSVDGAMDRLDLSGYEEWAAFQISRPEVLELEVQRMYQLLDGGD